MADRLYTVNKWNKKRYSNKYPNGGWFNLSQEVNPFSKQNYKGTIGALGPVVGQVGSGLISDGYSDGVGSGITNLGGTVGGAISTVNPLVGGIVSAASGVVGGLVNRAFGTKENKANINTITQNTQHMNQLGNQIAGAGDSTTFFNMAGNMGTSSGFSSGDLVKGGWFSKGKARRKAQKYLDAENSALAFQNHGMALGALGVDQNQDDNTLYHFSAYGGPLDMINNDNMGAIEYGFMSDWLANKKAKEDRLKEKGDNTTLMNEPLSTMFAEGGGIEIKHPGRLTALKKRTGKTEAELWAEGKPEVRKMITFARNARKWNHALGGYLDARDTLIEAGNLFEDGGLVPAINNIEEAPVDNTYIPQPRLTAPRTTKDVTRGMSTESPYLNSKDKLGYFLNDIYIQKNKNDKKAQNRRSITKEQAATIKDMVDKRYPEAAISRTLSDMLYENYNNSFALGGVLQSHGSDWSNGSTHIDEGETHEQNPYGGVQVGVDSQGTPNLVEEGEVIWNDYVYSNRIPVDEATKEKFHINKKRDMTYADLAKKLEKEIEERPNDPVSRAGFQSQMLTLQEQQERQKQEMEAERARAAFESLSPEEQVAMMQQAAQQEQAAQEQAMQEQAIAEQAQMEQAEPQQPVEEEMYAPEEMGYMSEEVPTEEMPEEGYAEGGNLYPDGGALSKLNYKDFLGQTEQEIFNNLAEEYLDVSDATLRAKAKELASQGARESNLQGAYDWLSKNTSYSNDYKKILAQMMMRKPVGYMGGGINYESSYNKLIPTVNFSNANVEKYFKSLIDNGIDFETAFEIVNSKRGQRDALSTRRAEAQLKKLLGLKYNSSNNTSSSSVAAPGRTTSASSATQSNTSNGRGFLSALRANLKDGREALAARAQQVDNNTVIPEEAAASVSASGAPKGRATYGTTASPMMYSGTGYGAPATRPATRRGSSTNRATSTSINSSSSAGSVVSNPTPAQQEPATVVPIPVVTNDGIVINPLTGEPDFIPTEGLVQNNAVYANNDFAADKAAGYPTADPSSYNSEYSSTKSETATGKEEEKKNEKVPFVTSKESRLRYIPAIGGAIGLAYDLFSKPDYSRADAVINASRNMTPMMIQPTYLGDYLTYRPMDIWAEQNRMNANARATDRAIRNSNSPSRMAGLLASGYNSQIASGDLYKKALEYNNALRERTAAFNRGTNQFNAQMNTNTQRANQSAALSGQHYGLQGLITGNQMKDAIDARRGASISANLGNVLQSLGNIGEEAFDMDRLRWLEATDVLRSKTLNQNKYGGMLTKKNKKGGKC